MHPVLDINYQINDYSGSMPVIRARLLCNSLAGDRPFYTRIEFIESLAALVAMYPDEVVRIAPGPNKPVFHILWSAAAVDRIEWYFNNSRMRHSISTSQFNLLHSGTTSNEALHAEINNWFRQTQTIHQATVQLKLQVMGLSKLIAHNSAMYRPTSRQMSASAVLARSTCCPIWTNRSWRDWCNSLLHERTMAKPELAMVQKRNDAKQLVKQHILKRPAAVQSAAIYNKKRTAFSRKREGLLCSQGH
jgi:hypothetical protein